MKRVGRKPNRESGYTGSALAGPYGGQDDKGRREIGEVDDCRIMELREDFEYTINQRDTSVLGRARLNHDTRYCIWPGQSEDGRKWAEKLGEDEVFPWKGASDARVSLVDHYIQKHVAFLLVLWKRMKARVQATESNDEAWAQRMTTLLRWMKYTQMTEARTETELLLNYMLERGSAVKGCFWNKRTQLAYFETDLEGIATMALQRAQGPRGEQKFLDLPQMLFDPSKDTESAPLLGELLEEPETQEEERSEDEIKDAMTLPPKRLMQLLSELRLHGYARFPRPMIAMNRPKVVAYCPNEDVFISPDARYGLDDASVHIVEVMREAKLRGQARDYGWDEAWTENVVETQRGVIEFSGLVFNQRLSRQNSYLMPSRGQLDTRKQYIVIHSYRRLADANGVEGVFYTVWHPHVAARAQYGGTREPLYAKHELLNYAHGKMPFTLYMTERRSRKIDDARGYGERANTWQAQIKTEWDNRIDRSSISTLPPSHYPPGLQPDKWGPGVQIPTSTPDAYGFFQPTGDPAGSKEVEESVRMFANEYFGEAHMTPEDITDGRTLKQKLADGFMEGEQQTDTMILQLCQQFMPDEFYFRVVGSDKGRPIHSTRDEIQGQFDLQIGFDVGDMMPEQIKEKMAVLQQMLSMDINGIIDHNEALVMAFEMFDPNAGERLLKPAEAAAAAEVEDEQVVALKLLKGQKVPVKPGQAYQQRLQALMQFLQQNQAALSDVKSNEQAQEAVQQRIKDLGFQIQQQQNAVIGRGGPAFPPKGGGR